MLTAPVANGSHAAYSSRVSGPHSIGVTSMKIHSLKQTKDLVTEIVSSKLRYDEQCLTNKQPRETMEQFMFTFLNQRYGLKQLIVDWASSLVQAVKMYSGEDAWVLLFGKMLKNAVDEDFWFT